MLDSKSRIFVFFALSERSFLILRRNWTIYLSVFFVRFEVTDLLFFASSERSFSYSALELNYLSFCIVLCRNWVVSFLYFDGIELISSCSLLELINNAYSLLELNCGFYILYKNWTKNFVFFVGTELCFSYYSLELNYIFPLLCWNWTKVFIFFVGTELWISFSLLELNHVVFKLNFESLILCWNWTLYFIFFNRTKLLTSYFFLNWTFVFLIFCQSYYPSLMHV